MVVMVLWMLIRTRRHTNRGITGKIDAVYQTNLGNNSKLLYDIIFAGQNYYLYKQFKQISRPYPLRNLGLPNNVKKIDAAMKWWKNNKVYFFLWGSILQV